MSTNNAEPGGSRHNPVQLPVGATAAPDTCGSCRHFKRETDYGRDRGSCCVVLPPWVQERSRTDVEDETPYRMVKDVHRCDLQTPTSKFYTVSTVVGPQGAI